MKQKRRTTRKRNRTRRTPYNTPNQALKIVNTGMQATIGLAALGLTVNAVSNIVKK